MTRLFLAIFVTLTLALPALAQEKASSQRLTADALGAFPSELVALAVKADQVAKQTAGVRAKAIAGLEFARNDLKAAVELPNLGWLQLRLVQSAFLIAELDVVFVEVELMSADMDVIEAYTAMKNKTDEQVAQFTPWMKFALDSYYQFPKFKVVDDDLKMRVQKRIDEMKNK